MTAKSRSPTSGWSARIAEAKITSTSVILGTAAYLSPEQVSTGDAGPASDVYAVGILTYELLTGNNTVQGRLRADGRIPANGQRRRRAEHRDRRRAKAIRRTGAASDCTEPGRPVCRRRGHGDPSSTRSSTSWGCPTSAYPRRATRRNICRRRFTAAASASTPPPRLSRPAPPRQHTRELTRGPEDWRDDEPTAETYGVAGQFAGIDMDEFYWPVSEPSACCSSGWSRCSF